MWALALTGAAAVVVFICTLLSMRWGDEITDLKDRVSAHDIERARADGVAEGVKAGERAGQAQSAAETAQAQLERDRAENRASLSEANERVARAELDATKTRQAVESRRLSSKFAKSLERSKVMGEAELYISASAPDGMSFMFELQFALERAGWHVLVTHTPPPNVRFLDFGGQDFGITLAVDHPLKGPIGDALHTIQGPDDAPLQALADAFKADGLAVIQSFHPGVPHGVVRVLIAPKPAAYLQPYTPIWATAAANPR